MAGPDLDEPFFGALRALGQAMRAPAPWILLILWIESGLQPHAPHNPKFPDYWGLNQMNGGYLRSHGVVPEEYETWPASAQLEKVIGPWLAAAAAQALHGAPPPTAGALYAVNFLPGRVESRGSGDAVVLTKAGDTDGFYEPNAGLDSNKDGQITIGDLNVFLAKHALDTGFVASLLRLGVDTIDPDPEPAPAPAPAPTSGPSRAGTAMAVFGLSLLAAGGGLWLATRQEHAS